MRVLSQEARPPREAGIHVNRHGTLYLYTHAHAEDARTQANCHGILYLYTERASRAHSKK